MPKRHERKASGSTSAAIAKVAADEALQTLEREMRTSFEIPVFFEDLDSALRQAAAPTAPDAIVFIALGASWSLPCRMCFQNLAAAAATDKAVRVILVDHELFRGFCSEVTVGVPVTTATCGGRPVLFKGASAAAAPAPTPRQASKKLIVGLLSPQQCTDTIDAIRNTLSLQGAASTDLEVSLPFDLL